MQADQRLEQGGGDLVGQGDQADLGEAEVEGILEHRVGRDHHRLHEIVEEMGDGDGGQHRHRDVRYGLGGKRRAEGEGELHGVRWLPGTVAGMTPGSMPGFGGQGGTACT